jgi:tetratricopeptide (TPR) repeat protein
MSLLLDALKRAAQEKLEKQRQDEAGAVDSPDALSLDIAEGENEVQRTQGAQDSSDSDNAADDDLRMHRADVLASELQAFMGRTNTEYTMEHHDPDLEPAPPEPEESKTGSVSFVTRPASASTPAAAGRMFANKRASGIRSKRGMLIAAAVVAVVLSGIVFTVYLSSLNQSAINVDRLRADDRALPPVAAADAPVDSKKVETALLIEQEDIGSLLEENSTTQTSKTSTPDYVPPAVPDGTQPADSAGQPVAQTKAQTEIKADEPVQAPRNAAPRLKVQRNRQEALHAILLRAYSDYQSNDMAAAEAGYRQALARAPENRDALLGFAATAIQRGDYAAAMESYVTLLNQDPNDDLALAGISGLKQDVQGVAPDESGIKRLLLKKPESAQLHFALGNLYSAGGDWPKAQSAYFDAHRFDAQNPDYAYNLAVSLEHLQQAEAALRYYGLALTLASARKSNFDSAQAAGRISLLQAQTPATDAR